MILNITAFDGIYPKVAEYLLPQNSATIALNCTLDSGAIEPLNGVSSVSATLRSGAQTITRHANVWGSWTQKVHVVKSPVTSDMYNRIYWSGDTSGDGDFLKYADATKFTTGGPPYPQSSYTLGLPEPNVSSVTVSKVGTPSTTDPLFAEDRAYVWCWKTTYGELGPPSTPLYISDVYPGHVINFSNLPTDPSVTGFTQHNITEKVVFRTNTGSTSTEYQYVTTVPKNSTTFSDSVAGTDLGYVLPSAMWERPPAGLRGLISTHMGALAAFKDNVVYFSEPFLPHAWPYQYTVPNTVVAIGAYGNTILVLTTGHPAILTGNSPDALTLEKPEEGYACVSADGVVDIGYSIIYPSPVGLILVGVNGVENLTEKLFSVSDWESLVPSSIRAFQYRNGYLWFCNGGSFYLDLTENKLTNVNFDFDDYVAGGMYNPATAELYLIKSTDSSLWKWNSDTPLVFTWRSKPFVINGGVSFSCARIIGNQSPSQPVAVTFIADSSVYGPYSITSTNPFRLPAGTRSANWSVMLTGNTRVDAVQLAQSISELGGWNGNQAA